MKRIPKAAVARLLNYLRFTEEAEREGEEFITAQDIGEKMGINPHLVRRDFAYLGQFGERGKGYRVKNLKDSLRKIMKLDRIWEAVLVGVGNLGSALLRYPGFLERGFRIRYAFDISPAKVGKKIGGVEILPLKELDRVVQREGIKIGIITVPKESAGEIGEKLCKAGIQGIVNFAPLPLRLPPPIKVINVDLSLNLETVAFYLSQNVG